MRVYIIIIITFSILGCKKQSNIKIEYYESGSKKTEYRIDNKGILNGVSKSFYPNGKLKYIGEYIDGLRNGEHKDYYPNGNLKQLFTYTIEIGHEKCISKKIYDEERMIIFDGKFVVKDFSYVKLNTQKILPGDTLKLLVGLKDPAYFNSVIFLGDYDPYLNIGDTSNDIIEFDGKKNEVIVSVIAKPGKNIIKGLFRDFTFELYPNNDTLAYTGAEESYFEYQFKSDPQINL